MVKLNLLRNPAEEMEIGFLLDLPGDLEIHFDQSSCINASVSKVEVAYTTDEFYTCYNVAAT